MSARISLVAAALLLVGCGSSDPDAATADAGPTLGPALAHEVALERAYELGVALAAPVDAVRTSDEPLADAVAGAFGPELERRELYGWLEVGDAFRFRPGRCDSLATTEAPSGRPAVVMASLDPSLFYEWTVVETDTGAVYQSVGQVSAGCDTGTVDFFGPFVPGDQAIITGEFNIEQRRELAFAIGEGVRDALESRP